MDNRIIEILLSRLLRQRVTWFLFAIFGTINLFFQDEIDKIFHFNYTAHYALRVVSLSFIVIAISIFLLDYLRVDRYNKKRYEDGDDFVRRNIFMTEELRSQIMEIRNILAHSNSPINKSDTDKIVTLTENDKEKLFDIITKTVSKNINEEFLKSLDEKYSIKIASEVRYKELLQNFDQTRIRIMRELDSLTRRGNLNLVIGSITTIIAVAVLFTSVYSKDLSFTETAKALGYFIPRVSTVIFIEIFSFFFLKLYRSNLNDVKYYQNEMTNIEFKTLSLKTALMSDDKETLRQIISDMNKTERNFILQKGETTAEIETSKNQNKFDKSFTDNLKSLSEIIRPKKKE